MKRNRTEIKTEDTSDNLLAGLEKSGASPRPTSKKQTLESNGDNQFNLLAALEEENKTTIPRQPLPEPNKHGEVNFVGYMDSYFRKQPPVPSVNLIVDNHTLQVIEDLRGQM